ncbi:5-methylcytosine-specific restriction endonuclease system specificity protein McrC [Endobacterium cereale]|uniref:5-methylcytosine-specific restriction endonuclease system specificity protein McrC n=1 Tax=Endobacterium cereale TaxID=2663029 RepID=UPI002B47595F|nr:5-methylcytosine-specific restriction endonuclease system specificity protein McrC [Endobacterium cereale]MEB2848080.1 5-methylcytosine-specific restriction endonuclease system specificity protein McrC [Endobacterium cereale]
MGITPGKSQGGSHAEPWKSQVGIPVRNLWVLLAYASGLAQFLDPCAAQVDEDAELPDILARLLVSSVERRLRRGLSRGYELRSAQLNRVKGRIDWLATESGQLLSKGRIACRFEHLTHDTPRNRLVAAALMRASTQVRNRELGRKCSRLTQTLIDAGVAPTRPSRSEMSKEKFGRNDADDELLVRVAGIMLDMMLPSEQAGDINLSRLDHDERLLREIFEKAIEGFYRLELHGRDGWKVGRQSVFEWPAVDLTDGMRSILPRMHADLVLQEGASRRIVLDTKFTGILRARHHGNDGLKSEYIYQIYSYIRSQAGRNDIFADNAEGILLHPSLDRHLDEAFTVQGHRLRFATVDLAADSEALRNRLREIVLVTA